MHLGSQGQAASHLATRTLGEGGGATEASAKASAEEVGVGKAKAAGALWRGEGLWEWLEWWVKARSGFAPIVGGEGGAWNEIYP